MRSGRLQQLLSVLGNLQERIRDLVHILPGSQEQGLAQLTRKNGSLVTLPEYYRLDATGKKPQWSVVSPKEVPPELSLTQYRFETPREKPQDPRTWTKDRNYLASPDVGALAHLDPALILTPPHGMEVGYVPIATRQELGGSSRK